MNSNPSFKRDALKQLLIFKLARENMLSSKNNFYFLVTLLFVITGCAPKAPVVSPANTYVDNLTISDLVKLSFQKNAETVGVKTESKMCGYALTPTVWNLKFTQPKKEHEVVHCSIPNGMYILLELTSSHNILMNKKNEDDCKSLSDWPMQDVDRCHDPDLWIDSLYITDLSAFRYQVQGCPTPFLQEGNIFAGHRSAANGYFVLIDPLESSRHRITFSVTNPCWPNLRDINTGKCPQKESRRVVEMFLTIGTH